MLCDETVTYVYSVASNARSQCEKQNSEG